MIILCCNVEKNKKTGRYATIASHAYDTQTGRNIVVPQENPLSLGAVWDIEFNEWILEYDI